jgi:DNA-binding HxlR family transcriptional regulator
MPGTTGVADSKRHHSRAGSHVLSLLATPLNVEVIQALADGPKPLAQLRAADLPPRTTIGERLRALVDAGVVLRRREASFPGTVEYALSNAGRELLPVTAALRGWLRASPFGPIPLGGAAARRTVGAMLDGWSSTIVRTLAAKPLTLTDLSTLIDRLSHPALERRLKAMRRMGLVERRSEACRRSPYVVTDWLRRAVVPLAVGARWERAHASPNRAASIERIDIESAILLVVPLTQLPSSETGTCRLIAEATDESGRDQAVGAFVALQEGRVVSCHTNIERDSESVILGSVEDWLEVAFQQGGRIHQLKTSGRLGTPLLAGICKALFRYAA